ncbi:MAG TPA: putative baseplate assembly protein, partial [Roseiflexaceae bacterium]|nr:putative baseplate assembly protein [Roseiflexaceae bacterium]
RRGELLTMIAAPAARPAGRQRWQLRTISGLHGSLEAPGGAIVPRPTEKSDPFVSELRTVARVLHTNLSAGISLTTLEFDQPLNGIYDAASVTINLNVVAATHGETIHEVLGSGDATRANQHFLLRRPPLTYTSAATPAGIASSLTLRVDGVRWEEAVSLYRLGPRDEHYTVRIDDDGTSRVTFGDGLRGARLPSGNENVRVVYRSGIGSAGEVAATSLSLLKSRPAGVRAVTNPLAATGAEDPEHLEDARINAPLTVLTMGRIVSLRDYEDFARGFPGIGKAQAITLWNGANRMIHLTIASASGKPIAAADPLRTNLVAAIERARDPLQPVVVDTFALRRFTLRAGLRIDRRLLFEAVDTAVRQALQVAFGFTQRGFGQQVTSAEVIAVIQGVAGVEMVDLDMLALAPGSSGLPVVLGAEIARRVGSTILPAELLLIDPMGVVLQEITP